MRLRDDVGGVGHVLVVVGGFGPDLLLGELVGEVAQGLLLIRERERQARRKGVLGYGHLGSFVRSID